LGGGTLPRCGPLSVLLYPPQRDENPATPRTSRFNAKGVASLAIKALTVGETRKGLAEAAKRRWAAQKKTAAK